MKKISALLMSIVIIFSVLIPPTQVYAAKNLGFIWPVESRVINQEYKTSHHGIDLGANMNDPIYATQDGVIWAVYTGCHNVSGKLSNTPCRKNPLCEHKNFAKETDRKSVV